MQWLTTICNACRIAQRDPSKAIIGESRKLLANSAYGKMCEDRTRFRRIWYCNRDEARVAIKSSLFYSVSTLSSTSASPTVTGSSFKNPDSTFSDDEALDSECIEEDQMDAIFEVTESYKKVTLDQTIQVSFFVYQYAKMNMLEFQYDLVDRYLVHQKWSPMYMDTDSLYMSISGSDLRDVVKPELLEVFYRDVYAQWFPSESCEEHHPDFVQTMVSGRPWTRSPCCEERNLYDQKTPGLFKVEWQGEAMVALCSKTYFCSGQVKDKMSCKGIQKSRNSSTLSYEKYKRILLTQRPGEGSNMGFRFDPTSQTVYTYSQSRKGCLTCMGSERSSTMASTPFHWTFDCESIYTRDPFY